VQVHKGKYTEQDPDPVMHDKVPNKNLSDLEHCYKEQMNITCGTVSILVQFSNTLLEQSAEDP
jgi:hypothetical protein